LCIVNAKEGNKGICFILAYTLPSASTNCQVKGLITCVSSPFKNFTLTPKGVIFVTTPSEPLTYLPLGSLTIETTFAPFFNIKVCLAIQSFIIKFLLTFLDEAETFALKANSGSSIFAKHSLFQESHSSRVEKK
jgi:hypothetical protein